jgi:hypothetical protein
MPPQTEPTVAERLSYVDRLKAEARQFAAKIKQKSRIPAHSFRGRNDGRGNDWRPFL